MSKVSSPSEEHSVDSALLNGGVPAMLSPSSCPDSVSGNFACDIYSQTRFNGHSSEIADGFQTDAKHPNNIDNGSPSFSAALIINGKDHIQPIFRTSRSNSFGNATSQNGDGLTKVLREDSISSTRSSSLNGQSHTLSRENAYNPCEPEAARSHFDNEPVDFLDAVVLTDLSNRMKALGNICTPSNGESRFVPEEEVASLSKHDENVDPCSVFRHRPISTSGDCDYPHLGNPELLLLTNEQEEAVTSHDNCIADDNENDLCVDCSFSPVDNNIHSSIIIPMDFLLREEESNQGDACESQANLESFIKANIADSCVSEFEMKHNTRTDCREFVEDEISTSESEVERVEKKLTFICAREMLQTAVVPKVKNHLTTTKTGEISLSTFDIKPTSLNNCSDDDVVRDELRIDGIADIVSKTTSDELPDCVLQSDRMLKRLTAKKKKVPTATLR